MKKEIPPLSVSPNGESFPLPRPEDYACEGKGLGRGHVKRIKDSIRPHYTLTP
jgi:hypothetical protein